MMGYETSLPSSPVAMLENATKKREKLLLQLIIDLCSERCVPVASRRGKGRVGNPYHTMFKNRSFQVIFRLINASKC